MKNNIIPTEMYLTHIREALTNYDIHTIDIANKMALEIGTITLDTYLAAAHILVDARLAQI